MTFSVQQIKFDCFSYIKEFGARMEDWTIGMAEDPEQAMFDTLGIDRDRDIWLWKPAMTPVAARTVVDFMVGRYRLDPAPGFGPGRAGRCVFMYRRSARPA